jgi:hypothetical protein
MKYATRLLSGLIQPFYTASRIDIRIVSAFLAINGLVFANARMHDPAVGYDSASYFRYIRALSAFHLVTSEESNEFFSPPLPFVAPAAIVALTGDGVTPAAKISQYLNVVLSIGLTWFLIKTCRLLDSRASLSLGALVFLGILPVYYKTFAFVRGEPYAAFFASVMLYYTLLIVLRGQPSPTNATGLGMSMGLCALSRQWGILLFPPILLLLFYQWVRLPERRGALARAIGLCTLVATVVGGWFYVYLRVTEGSAIAFNRGPAARFSFDNKPPEFYVGVSPMSLFNEPIRPHFPNQFIPIFYSEVWGDYWCYFSVYGRDLRTSAHVSGLRMATILSSGNRPAWLETNYDTIGGYLGEVNRVSLFPSALALASLGLLVGSLVRVRDLEGSIPGDRMIHAFLLSSIGCYMLGYFWFLIMYPSSGGGDTIKATYVLPIVPVVAVSVGIFLERLEARSSRLFYLILGVLLIIALHNISAMVTHY